MAREGILFVVSAPSGAGKTSLCKEIVLWVDNLQHSISYTTRAPRPGEVPDVDYHFVDQKTFLRMVEEGAFVEWAVVHGNYYGTHRGELQALLDQGVDVILDIDSQGAMQIRKQCENGVFIYILPPSFEDLERRLRARRGDAPEEIARRMARAREEVRDYVVYDYLIINDDFQKALEHLKAIVTAERIRVSRADRAWLTRTFFQAP